VPKTATVFPLALSAAMSGGVYASGQSAENDQPSRGQIAG
jgi:hypothetical protein